MSDINFTLAMITDTKADSMQSSTYPYEVPNQALQQNIESCAPQYEKLQFDNGVLTNLFPHCAKKLYAPHIATLLASTRIVGMKTPGLHSIYASLKLKAQPKANSSDNPVPLDSTMYYTHSTHPLLKRATIKLISPTNAVQNALQGEIKAFIRPQKIQNQSLKQIATQLSAELESQPFATQKALVIGAGSGLGNVCAKILALGGARVLAGTYSQQFDEAHSHIQSLSLDVLHLSKDALKSLATFAPTHLYYFATPRIDSAPKKQCAMLDKKSLFHFLQSYVLAPSTLLSYMPTCRALFQPSSIFVTELPLEFMEYTLAKTALESYGKFLTKQGIYALCPRLPKIETNQTLSLIPQILIKPSNALLEPLLAFAKATKNATLQATSSHQVASKIASKEK